jgi:hypothetical protein
MFGRRDWLFTVFVPLENLSHMETSSLPVKGFLCSALRASEQGRIVIVPRLLWHGASAFPVSPEGLPHAFTRLLRYARGCWGHNLSWILKGFGRRVFTRFYVTSVLSCWKFCSAEIYAFYVYLKLYTQHLRKFYVNLMQLHVIFVRCIGFGPQPFQVCWNEPFTHNYTTLNFVYS